MEELGVGRVDVFGRHLGRERAPAEGDDAAARILDREDDPVAEAVVGDGDVGAEDDQTAGLDLRLVDALVGQVLLQRVAAVGREAEAERLLGGRGDAALAQIGAGLRATGRLQRVLEEAGGEFHDVVEAGAFLLALLALGIARGHGHARHVGYALDGLWEAEPVELHQEAEMVARHAAAEAVVAALAVLAVEARRVLAMERAAGPPVAARGVGLAPVPRHAAADERRYRHAVAYLGEEGIGKAHGPAGLGVRTFI